MTLSDQGAQFICAFEGFKSKPYQDSGGVWTIGYGTTFYPNGTAVKGSDPAITTQQGIQYLQSHANSQVSPGLNSLLPGISQNQFDALSCFIYNVGMGNFKTSSLLRDIKAGAGTDVITADFAKWNKGGGQVLAGLVKRRAAEADLYCNSNYNQSA